MSAAPVKTLHECLRATAAANAERLAYTFDEIELTYKQFYGAVCAMAAALSKQGVGPGQRVAIFFPNCPQFPISYFAVLHLGATVVPLHCLQGAEELSYVVNDSGAETLIALNVFAPVVTAIREHASGLKRVIISGETDLPDVQSFEQLLQTSPADAPFDETDPEHVAVLIYTSGTTGRPKGAMLTHHNLYFNASTSAEVLFVTPEDCFLTVLPLFHSFGATVCMIIPLLMGAHCALLPRFTPLGVLETIERRKCTFFAGVPSMYAVLVGMKSDREFNLNSIRCAVTGGAAMSPEVMLGFEKRYKINIIEGYGPTEASPVVSLNPPHGVKKIGTVGTSLPGVEVRIVDEDLNTVPLGETGELVVRGENVMKGYWNDPERTAETIRNGWLLTGDMGTMDEDNYIRIVDRKKDMIIVGGMNVYPREVEDVIMRMPQIMDVAVIGVPSSLRGEDIIAVAALKEDQLLDSQAVIDFCKEHLANYKVPRIVEFRKELPLSGTGKILKRVLRDEFSTQA